MKQAWTKEQMAQKAVLRLKNGYCVNLGVGMPTIVPNFVPKDVTVFFQSENGLLGYGLRAEEGSPDYDPNMYSVGGVVKIAPGMSISDHAASFVMIRGGHLDVTILGAFQVAENGDLANWRLPTKKIGSIGGAMDLAFGAKSVFVIMEHTLKDGTAKVVKKCTYPLTGLKCVDVIITDIAVMEVTDKGLVVTDMAPGYTLIDVQAVTEPTLKAAPGLK